MADCIFGVKINKVMTDDTAAGAVAGQYLEVSAVSNVNMRDNAIFIYSREPALPETGVYDSYFEAIATPNDMEELNSGEPSASDSTTIKFRDDNIKVYFKSRTELEDGWEYIKTDINYLIKSMALRCQHLGEPVGIVINTIDPAASDDSAAGYPLGTLWQNTLTNVEWISVQDSSTAAIWSVNSATPTYQSTSPTSTDDESSGYTTGSLWIDTTLNARFICTDPSVANAIWVDITQ
jgi:hypothetical protein